MPPPSTLPPLLTSILTLNGLLQTLPSYPLQLLLNSRKTAIPLKWIAVYGAVYYVPYMFKNGYAWLLVENVDEIVNVKSEDGDYVLFDDDNDSDNSPNTSRTRSIRGDDKRRKMRINKASLAIIFSLTITILSYAYTAYFLIPLTDSDNDNTDSNAEDSYIVPVETILLITLSGFLRSLGSALMDFTVETLVIHQGRLLSLVSFDVSEGGSVGGEVHGITSLTSLHLPLPSESGLELEVGPQLQLQLPSFKDTLIKLQTHATTARNKGSLIGNFVAVGVYCGMMVVGDHLKGIDDESDGVSEFQKVVEEVFLKAGNVLYLCVLVTVGSLGYVCFVLWSLSCSNQDQGETSGEYVLRSLLFKPSRVSHTPTSSNTTTTTSTTTSKSNSKLTPTEMVLLTTLQAIFILLTFQYYITSTYSSTLFYILITTTSTFGVGIYAHSYIPQVYKPYYSTASSSASHKMSNHRSLFTSPSLLYLLLKLSPPSPIYLISAFNYRTFGSMPIVIQVLGVCGNLGAWIGGTGWFFDSGSDSSFINASDSYNIEENANANNAKSKSTPLLGKLALTFLKTTLLSVSTSLLYLTYINDFTTSTDPACLDDGDSLILSTNEKVWYVTLGLVIAVVCGVAVEMEFLPCVVLTGVGVWDFEEEVEEGGGERNNKEDVDNEDENEDEDLFTNNRGVDADISQNTVNNKIGVDLQQIYKTDTFAYALTSTIGIDLSNILSSNLTLLLVTYLNISRDSSHGNEDGSDSEDGGGGWANLKYMIIICGIWKILGCIAGAGLIRRL